MRAVVVTLTAILALVATLLPEPLSAQVWESAAQHPGDPAWEATTNYPVVFVSYRITEQTTATSGQNCTGSGLVGSSNIGLDAVDISLPKRGNELWILLSNGQVKRLFPYSNHQSIVDSPIGTLGNINGTVLEPSISLDGRAVYFSYLHDTANNNSGVGYSKGADIYRIDLGPLLDNAQVDPSTLPVKRLTQTTSGNKFSDAMNPTLASSGSNGFGNMYLGATEMNTYFGTRLVFVSDSKRLLNSNMHQGSHNRNFNLYEANINPDSSLGEIKQFQYYTTTSVLSPTRLRNGIAFSYQSTTEMNRQWQIQSSDSAGKWAPLYGYGIRTTVAHNTTFCRKTTPAGVADFVLTGSYYNVNNAGFGAVIAQDMSKAGTNDYDSKSSQGVKLPFQVGSYNFTNNVSDIHDDPSVKAPNGQYYGKFATPACAEPDRVYLAYTPTSANDKECDSDGNRSIYRSMIVTRDNLNSFDPVYSPAKIVVRDQNFDQPSAPARYGAVWPQPVVSHFVRTGDQYQQYSIPIFNPATGITPGDPFAMFGTSALYNTDVTSPDCKIAVPNGKAFSPNHTTPIQREAVVDNVANLTKLPSAGGFCAQPTAQEVFGIKIFLTSNEASMNGGGSGAGYETAQVTAGGKPQETKRLLGTYNVVGQSDTSFKALVPANAPMDFHLVERTTGLKFADVNSWHSLKPGELRADCGGCHNHKANAGIAWEGTYAETAPALNLTEGTQYIDYGLGCQVQYKTTANPVRDLPEWRQDIFPGFDRNCGGCHSVSGTNPAAAQARQAFQYGPENGDPAEKVLYDRLLARSFIFPSMGALSSPAFWAAYGSRTDGRNNGTYSGSATFQADYPNCSDTPGDDDCGYQFWSGHSGVCNSSLADASWVYNFGDWIDNHAPRDTGISASYKKDRFHPSVDGALSDPNCSITDNLHIGFWDDSGQLTKVEVLLNGTEIQSYTNEANGSKLIPLSSLGLSSSDTLKVKATDPAGNTQSYEKSVQDIVLECMSRNGYVPPPPTPTPSPTPDPEDGGGGGEQITLNVNTKSPKLGAILSFTLNSSLSSGNFVIVGSLSGKSKSSTISSPWNITLEQFVSDKVTSRTLKSFKGKLETSKLFSMKVPTGESGEWLLGKKFQFVALLQGPDGTIASAPIMVKFKPGNGTKKGMVFSKKAAKLGEKLANAAKQAKQLALKTKKK